MLPCRPQYSSHSDISTYRLMYVCWLDTLKLTVVNEQAKIHWPIKSKFMLYTFSTVTPCYCIKGAHVRKESISFSLWLTYVCTICSSLLQLLKKVFCLYLLSTVDWPAFIGTRQWGVELRNKISSYNICIYRAPMGLKIVHSRLLRSPHWKAIGSEV